MGEEKNGRMLGTLFGKEFHISYKKGGTPHLPIPSAFASPKWARGRTHPKIVASPQKSSSSASSTVKGMGDGARYEGRHSAVSVCVCVCARAVVVPRGSEGVFEKNETKGTTDRN